MSKTGIRALALLAMVAIFAPPWGRAQERSPSPATGMAEARVLFGQGRFQEALAVARALRQAHPRRKDVLFFVGLAAIESSRRAPQADRDALLDEAIGALRTILIDEPGLVRVRLELARAFFYKGRDGLSQEHFERVLAGNPPAPVVANVRRFLAQIRARRRWNMHLGFAVAPDTNIGGTSNEKIIYIYGLPFHRDQESLTTSGVGLSVWGGGEYQHPLHARVRLRMGADATRQEYAGGQFDRMLVSLHVGPRVLATPSTEFSVLGDWRHQWSANEPDYFDTGVRVSVNHRLNRRLRLDGQASWHDRQSYKGSHLDGTVQRISLTGGWVLKPTVRLYLSGGYGRDRHESVRHRNESKWARMATSVALPRGFSVGFNAGVRWTNFSGNWHPFVPDGSAREDVTYSLQASVHNRAITFFGFSPEVSLIHEVRNTNAQLYDYKRTGGQFRVVRQF